MAYGVSYRKTLVRGEYCSLPPHLGGGYEARDLICVIKKKERWRGVRSQLLLFGKLYMLSLVKRNAGGFLRSFLLPFLYVVDQIIWSIRGKGR